MRYAIGLKFNGYSDRLAEVRQENGWYILSPVPLPEKVTFEGKFSVMPLELEIKSADDQTKEDFRNALIKQDYSKEFFREVSSGAIKGMKGETKEISNRATYSISNQLARYNQECKAWKHTWVPTFNRICYPWYLPPSYTQCYDIDPTCLEEWPYTCSSDLGNDTANIRNLAGCTPVAFAILLEYWDRNGFSQLVGSTSDNSNSDHTDEDVRYTIDRLRYHMETMESGGRGEDGCREAGTNPRKMADGLSAYVKERGYRRALNSAHLNIPGRTGAIYSSLLNKRPIILNIKTADTAPHDVIPAGTPDHTVVAASYVDNGEGVNDTVCLNMGWAEPNDRCVDTATLGSDFETIDVKFHTSTVTVSKTGTGSGNVTLDYITTGDCGGLTWNGNTGTLLCYGTGQIVLVARPDGDANLSGWSGDCLTNGISDQCVVGFDSSTPKNVSATFNKKDGDLACFYTDVNYGGTPFCAPIGTNYSDLRSQPGGMNWNDAIKSVKLSGNAQVTMYEAINYEMSTISITSSKPDLGQAGETLDWKRRASSLRVYPLAKVPTNGACFFENVNYSGMYFCAEVGVSAVDLRSYVSGMNWNDTISSVRLYGNAQVTMYEAINYEMSAIDITASNSDLYNVSGHWNEKGSSLRVYSRPTEPTNGACFFENVNYTGAYFCAPVVGLAVREHVAVVHADEPCVGRIASAGSRRPVAVRLHIGKALPIKQ
ncbi:hypothetical protein MBAV_002082 [Candidatus Magnetobacterium bavaricum]|uniref:Uncharacterized protein n=1 Tax=Candidatus Magnetobacterium bavaricum TaxID=29290 RepID=A0A0F3GUT1_9BACT|nr:hypothetical protein MBAV_002082 [Candidatus Magnetobacterium bavaricum]